MPCPSHLLYQFLELHRCVLFAGQRVVTQRLQQLLTDSPEGPQHYNAFPITAINTRTRETKTAQLFKRAHSLATSHMTCYTLRLWIPQLVILWRERRGLRSRMRSGNNTAPCTRGKLETVKSRTQDGTRARPMHQERKIYSPPPPPPLPNTPPPRTPAPPPPPIWRKPPSDGRTDARTRAHTVCTVVTTLSLSG